MAQALGTFIELRQPEGGGLQFLVEIGSLVSTRPSLETHLSEVKVRLEDTAGRSHRLRIVVVDDDDDVRAGLEALFDAWGQEVRGFSSIALTTGHLAALSATQQPDHILVDNWLPDGRGLDAVSHFRTLCPQARLTLLTGDTDVRTMQRARELDIQVLLKPVTALKLGELLLGV
jgi:CheY-like chemotaxis protein